MFDDDDAVSQGRPSTTSGRLHEPLASSLALLGNDRGVRECGD